MKLKKKTIALLSALFCVAGCAAAPVLTDADSLQCETLEIETGNGLEPIAVAEMQPFDTLQYLQKPGVLDRISGSRLFKTVYLGAPLIAGGLIVKHQDTKFRKLRNDFMPQFQRHVDDYMQLAPADSVDLTRKLDELLPSLQILAGQLALDSHFPSAEPTARGQHFQRTATRPGASV